MTNTGLQTTPSLFGTHLAEHESPPSASLEAWIAKAGSHGGSVPVAIGAEAEIQLARAKALLRPAAWGVASAARAAVSTLLLHLPAYEIQNAEADVIEAWWKTWEQALADVPLDLLQDGAKTILSMSPAFRKMPTPAEFREVLVKRKYLYLRKNRALLIEKLSKLPRRDAPAATDMDEAAVQEALARLGIKIDRNAKPAKDQEDLEDFR